MITLDLEYHSAENGQCRVYYTGPKGGLYCWQLDRTEPLTFLLHTCSRDGEPCCPVRQGEDIVVNTEPPLGDAAIEDELRKFLGFKLFTVCAAFQDCESQAIVTVIAKSYEDACILAVDGIDNGHFDTDRHTHDAGPTYVNCVVEGDRDPWKDGVANVPVAYSEDGVYGRAKPERDTWGRDETYTPEEWADAVANGDTRSGYWDWVDSCREAEAEVAAA